MADRYQNRPFPAEEDYHSGDAQHTPANEESDPLAELARLIGQSDSFNMGRANQPLQPRGVERYHQQEFPAEDHEEAGGPPPWLQHGVPEEEAPQDYPNPVHPLRRYATPLAQPETHYQEEQHLFDDAGQESDPSRYDEALYGPLDPPQPEYDQSYVDDPYAYQDERVEEPTRKRGGGMLTVVVVLLLAVIGTGAAFAYRTYIGSPRSGDPPIIKADTNPTKIVPASADSVAKVPDRLATGDGTEKIVPREEAPMDVNAKTGPRVVLPPLNPNPNPPSFASITQANPPPPSPGANNGTMPNSEPRKVRTLAVRGDQPDAAAQPVTSPPGTKPAQAVHNATPPGGVARGAPTSANASANAPLSLSPQTAQSTTPDTRTRVAATTPTQAVSSGGATGGGYVVQVSSQRNEADAQASFRSLQGKFPSVLGSRAPLIKRADLGEKGVYYRAMVGPFGSSDEAAQFCGNLKAAGGQCVVQRN